MDAFCSGKSQSMDDLCRATPVETPVSRVCWGGGWDAASGPIWPLLISCCCVFSSVDAVLSSKSWRSKKLKLFGCLKEIQILGTTALPYHTTKSTNIMPKWPYLAAFNSVAFWRVYQIVKRWVQIFHWDSFRIHHFELFPYVLCVSVALVLVAVVWLPPWETSLESWAIPKGKLASMVPKSW